MLDDECLSCHEWSDNHGWALQGVLSLLMLLYHILFQATFSLIDSQTTAGVSVSRPLRLGELEMQNFPRRLGSFAGGYSAPLDIRSC